METSTLIVIIVIIIFIAAYIYETRQVYTTDINYITKYPSEFEIWIISGAPKGMTCDPDNSDALCPVDGTVYLVQYKNNDPYYITWFKSWDVVNRVKDAGVVVKNPSSLPPNLQYIKGYVTLTDKKLSWY